MGRVGGGPVSGHEMVKIGNSAHLITVNKQERHMLLWREGVLLAKYRIALGAAANGGAKTARGG